MNVPRVVGLFTLIVAAAAVTYVRAEELSVNWNGEVHKVKGHYEYNKDGVPLLGLITAELKNNRVKFTTCGNTTLEVYSKELKPTLASCSTVPPGDGPWTADSKNITYLVKADSGSTTVLPKAGGAKINLKLTEPEKNLVAEAKPGDLVGIKFTASDGKPSIGVFATLPK